MNKTIQTIKLSIVIPAYNEEENIGILYVSIKPIMKSL